MRPSLAAFLLFSSCFTLGVVQVGYGQSEDEQVAPSMTDVVELRSGVRLEGQVLKRTDKAIWLDIGSTVLELDAAEVATIEASVDADARIRARREMAEDLFSVADDLPERTPHAHARRIGAAVVKISTPAGLGSGVILDDGGYTVTNAHVIQGETALRATVWFPQADGTLKRTVIEDVEIIALNNHLDLALVRIKHPEGGRFDIAPVEAADRVEAGQPVFAIGNPRGLERSLTQGVVSTRNRAMDGLSYIQTDTPINPGNSGGPLFNARGEVIGITNMIIGGSQSLGFAIPARYMKDFLRNREAFAYDPFNPNSGHAYHDPPKRRNFRAPSQLRDGSSATTD